MYPFTNMTIFGAIWYQGEANAGGEPEHLMSWSSITGSVLLSSPHSGYRTEQYACTFPAMITDWREKWHQNTGGQTDPMFPFGFVQVCFVLHCVQCMASHTIIKSHLRLGKADLILIVVVYD